MRHVLLIAVLLSACEVVDIELVNVPDGGAFQPPVGPACADSSTCLAGQFCEKAACGEALGHCLQRPPVCDGEARPECGCDGVTYWNDCLRRLAGVESKVDRGPCRNPRACDTGSRCPEGASCARVVFPNECGRVIAGACWVVPDNCEGGMPEHYYACGGPMTQCLDSCAAIRSEQPSARFPGLCP